LQHTSAANDNFLLFDERPGVSTNVTLSPVDASDRSRRQEQHRMKMV
jgi:hypothetical protein